MQPIAAPPLVPARPLQPEAAAAAAAAVAAAAVRQPGRPGHPSFSCRRRARLPSVGERWQARPQRGAAATATVAWSAQLPPAAFSLEAAGEVDWRVHVRSHAVENVVHVGQRLEHRVQHRLAALPGPARRLMAGGIAGAFGKTSTAPLETIKMALVSSSSTGVRQAAADIWARGGVRAFFRGNSVDVLRTIPSRAIELATYEQLKKVFRRAPPCMRHARACRRRRASGFSHSHPVRQSAVTLRVLPALTLPQAVEPQAQRRAAHP